MAKIQTAHVILLVSNKYALQLRDNKPMLPAAGKWSLFGGRINARETPRQAINREVSEELSIQPKKFRYLWFKDYHIGLNRDKVRTWFFVSNISNIWGAYKLREGEAANIFSFEQVKHLNMPSVMREAIEKFHALRKNR